MKKIFVFSELGDSSPLRSALLQSDYQVVPRLLRGHWFDCPLTMPPDLAVFEPAPFQAVDRLSPAISKHPVVGRVPWLLVLDLERLHLASALTCNDFIARGFTQAELLARVERVLDHRPGREVSLRSGPLLVDLQAQQAFVGERLLALPHREFALLRHFAQHPDRTWSREALLAAVWGQSYDGGVRTVDVHVQRLRVALGNASQCLQTVRQTGYRWQPQ